MNAKKLLLFTVIAVVSVGVIGRIAVAVAFPNARVTSWWRSPLRNQEVGGKSNSRHLWGWGYDIVPATSANFEKAKKVFPVAVNEGDHIHIQLV